MIQIKISPNEQNFTKILPAQSQLMLIISYPENYPDVEPNIHIEKVAPSSPLHIGVLEEKLKNLASESLGMSMVFNLAQFAKDWVSEECEKLESGEYENEEERIEDNKKLSKENEEKTKRNVSNLTPVTIESFKKWWSTFHQNLIKQEEEEKSLDDKRPTGRKLFEEGQAILILEEEVKN